MGHSAPRLENPKEDVNSLFAGPDRAHRLPAKRGPFLARRPRSTFQDQLPVTIETEAVLAAEPDRWAADLSGWARLRPCRGSINQPSGTLAQAWRSVLSVCGPPTPPNRQPLANRASSQVTPTSLCLWDADTEFLGPSLSWNLAKLWRNFVAIGIPQSRMRVNPQI